MPRILSGHELDQYVEKILTERIGFQKLYEERLASARSDLRGFLKKATFDYVTKPRLYSWLSGIALAVLAALAIASRTGALVVVIVLSRYYSVFGIALKKGFKSNTDRASQPRLYKLLDECSAEVGIKGIETINIFLASGIYVSRERRFPFLPSAAVLNIGILTLESLSIEQLRNVIIHQLYIHKYGAVDFRHHTAETFNHWVWFALLRVVKRQNVNTTDFYDQQTNIYAVHAAATYKADQICFEKGSTDFLLGEILSADNMILHRCLKSSGRKVERGETDSQFAVFKLYEEFRSEIKSPAYQKKLQGLMKACSLFDSEVVLGDRIRSLGLKQSDVEPIIAEATRMKDCSLGEELLGMDTLSGISYYLSHNFRSTSHQNNAIIERFKYMYALSERYGEFETFVHCDIQYAEVEYGAAVALEVAEMYAQDYRHSPFILYAYAESLAELYDTRAIDYAIQAVRLNCEFASSARTLISAVSTNNGIRVPIDLERELIRAEYLSDNILFDAAAYDNGQQVPYTPKPYELAACKDICEEFNLKEAFTITEPLLDGRIQKKLLFIMNVNKTKPAELIQRISESKFALIDFVYERRLPSHRLIKTLRQTPECVIRSST